MTIPQPIPYSQVARLLMEKNARAVFELCGAVRGWCAGVRGWHGVRRCAVGTGRVDVRLMRGASLMHSWYGVRAWAVGTARADVRLVRHCWRYRLLDACSMPAPPHA